MSSHIPPAGHGGDHTGEHHHFHSGRVDWTAWLGVGFLGLVLGFGLGSVFGGSSSGPSYTEILDQLREIRSELRECCKAKPPTVPPVEPTKPDPKCEPKKSK